jgi:hypothetical protein
LPFVADINFSCIIKLPIILCLLFFYWMALNLFFHYLCHAIFLLFCTVIRFISICRGISISFRWAICFDLFFFYLVILCFIYFHLLSNFLFCFWWSCLLFLLFFLLICFVRLWWWSRDWLFSNLKIDNYYWN